jgi:hypothetical protein
MTKKTVIASALFTASILMTGIALACDAAGPSTHMGQLMSIDAAKHTFTIRDAQTQGPITFTANDEIITGLKDASGSIMVNYTEEDSGNLNAVGVTF